MGGSESMVMRWLVWDARLKSVLRLDVGSDELHTSILLRAGVVTGNRVPPAPIGSQVGG